MNTQASTITGHRLLLGQHERDLEYLVSVGKKWKSLLREQPLTRDEMPKVRLYYELLEGLLDDIAKKRLAAPEPHLSEVCRAMQATTLPPIAHKPMSKFSKDFIQLS